MTNDNLVAGFGVSKSWVEDTMSAKFNQQVKVSEVEVLSVCGYMSAIARVHLDWSSDDEKLPKTVVAKIPSSQAAEEAWKKAGNTEQERNANDPIHEFMHTMETNIYSIFTDAPPVGVKAPIYYGSLPMSSTPILLIEDIDNATTVDLVDGFSENQLYQIVEQLVALHKWSRKTEDLWGDKVKFEFEVDPDSANFGRAVLAMMEQLVGAAPELKERVDMLKEHYCNNLTWLKDQLDKAKETGKSVFSHGDLWAPQILWRDDKIAAIVDWALCRRSNRCEDLLRVLTTCCTVEQRRKLTDSLLHHYVEKSHEDVTFEELKKEYVELLPYSCANFAFAICMWANSPVLRRGKEDDNDRVAEMTRRFVATIDDTAEAYGWKK